MINEVFGKYSRHVEFIGDEIKNVAQVGAFGSQVIHLASFANCCDDIEELVQAGADVNAIGDLGLRPLHYAVLAGNSEAVHLLLFKGGVCAPRMSMVRRQCKWPMYWGRQVSRTCSWKRVGNPRMVLMGAPPQKSAG